MRLWLRRARHIGESVGPRVVEARGGKGDSGGRVLQETTSRGLCGLVCPSRTSERGGKGYSVKGVLGEEGERVKERTLGLRRRHSRRY